MESETFWSGSRTIQALLEKDAALVLFPPARFLTLFWLGPSFLMRKWLDTNRNNLWLFWFCLGHHLHLIWLHSALFCVIYITTWIILTYPAMVSTYKYDVPPIWFTGKHYFASEFQFRTFVKGKICVATLTGHLQNLKTVHNWVPRKLMMHTTLVES